MFDLLSSIHSLPLLRVRRAANGRHRPRARQCFKPLCQLWPLMTMQQTESKTKEPARATNGRLLPESGGWKANGRPLEKPSDTSKISIRKCLALCRTPEPSVCTCYNTGRRRLRCYAKGFERRFTHTPNEAEGHISSQYEVGKFSSER